MNKSSIDEIELKQIFSAIFDYKFFIIAVSAISLSLGIFYSLSIENEYVSSSVLKTSDSNDQSSFLDQYSGVAALAGINIPSSETVNSSVTSIEKIKSRDFLKHLLSFNQVRANLGAAIGYDMQTEEIVYDKSLYDDASKKWVRKKSYPRQSLEPSHLELYKKYRSIVKISKDNDTGLINISVKHYSPVFAKEFLTLIIQQINETSRNKDIEETERSLIFLESKLRDANLMDIKQTLNMLITEQLKKQMLTNVSRNYILEPIDTPYVPEFKSSPNRALICILFLILGTISSIIWALLSFFYKN